MGRVFILVSLIVGVAYFAWLSPWAHPIRTLQIETPVTPITENSPLMPRGR